MLVIPLMLSAATRQECTQMLKPFSALEKAYDAVVQAGIAAPASEKVIGDFRREGGRIYAACKDKMSTTRWYMLGKKVNDGRVAAAAFHMPDVAELKRYAISHPPVVTEVRCGTVRQGIHLPQER